MSQTKIITKSGFTCEVNADALDDMELLETMGGLMANDTSAIFQLPGMVSRLIGKDGKAELYEHCRTEDGRVPTSRIMDEVTEILQGLGGDKKKS